MRTILAVAILSMLGACDPGDEACEDRDPVAVDDAKSDEPARFDASEFADDSLCDALDGSSDDGSTADAKGIIDSIGR